MYFFTWFSLAIFVWGGGVKKTLRNNNGGHDKCLLLMTRGGGVKKHQKPAYVIHGCSLRGPPEAGYLKIGTCNAGNNVS